MLNKKILFISSTGGHFNELKQVFPVSEHYDYYIVTEKDRTTEKLTNQYGKKISYLWYGTRKKIVSYSFKLLYNCFKSLWIYIKVRPKIIISTGAHTAGPMCCIGKLFGSKIIFIETFANRTTKTITGRIVYHFADVFIVQWKEMLELYPKAIYFDGGVY